MKKKKIFISLFFLFSPPITPVYLDEIIIGEEEDYYEETRNSGAYTVEVDGDFIARHAVTLGSISGNSDSPTITVSATQVGINSNSTSAALCNTTIGNTIKGGTIQLFTKQNRDISLQSGGATLINSSNGAIDNPYVLLGNVTAINSTIANNVGVDSGNPITLENIFVVNSCIPGSLAVDGETRYYNIISLGGHIPDTVESKSIIIGQLGTEGGSVSLAAGKEKSIDIEGGSFVLINDTQSAETHIGGAGGAVKIGYGTGSVTIGNSTGNNSIALGSKKYFGTITIGNTGDTTKSDPRILLRGAVTVNSTEQSNQYTTLSGDFFVNSTINMLTNATVNAPILLQKIITLNSDIPSSLSSMPGGATYQGIVMINGELPQNTTPLLINNAVIIGKTGSQGGLLSLSSGGGAPLTITAGSSTKSGPLTIDGAIVAINGASSGIGGTTIIGEGNGAITLGKSNGGNSKITLGGGSFAGEIVLGNGIGNPLLALTGNITLSGNITITGIGEPYGGTVYALAIDSAGNLYRTGISAKKYKTNITALPTKVDAFYELHPCQYSYKTTPNVVEYGFIADELEGILPEVVRYNDNGAPEGIHYQSIFVIAVQKLIKLKEEFDLLSREVALLKKEIEQLKK